MALTRAVAMLVAVMGIGVAGLAALLPSRTGISAERIASVALVPFGLAAGMVALGAGLLLALRSTGLLRILAVIVTVPAAGLTVVHVWWQAPLLVGGAPAARQPGITLLFQNVESAEPDAFTARVAASDPDVVVLAEPSAELVDAVLRSAHGGALPHRIGTGADASGSVVL
ncbi:MAG TPA: hypothetical protein VES95_10570, partial [Dermatophilaceae bacterium]|nr:hypothetical protein [Dermatophilaceae bacterium]